jgi:hypothetical protein
MPSKVCYECSATHSPRWKKHSLIMEEEGDTLVSICKECDEGLFAISLILL